MKPNREKKKRDMALAECLYYCVREDFNCIGDPSYREADSKILPAIEMMKTVDPSTLYRVEIESFCRALHRRHMFEELQSIPWIRIEVDKEPRLLEGEIA